MKAGECKPHGQRQRDTNAVLLRNDARLNELEAKITAVRAMPAQNRGKVRPSKVVELRSWEEISAEARVLYGDDADLGTILSPKQQQEIRERLDGYRKEFDEIHKLDDAEIYISVFGGLIGAAVDILLVGIPQRGPAGLEAKPLSDWIRQRFEQAFPPEEMDKLAKDLASHVPFDAQDNRHTVKNVVGLSAYYHRMLSLGHDPLLGFVVGVFDILTGRMTTIDKNGKFVSQVMECYTDRKETNLFCAIAKQFRHLASDVNTAMGLPAPLMDLFNLCQFGSIGEYDQTVAEIVQGMYYEGYDFIHFCSMSVPAMLIEVWTRLLYAFNRIREGYKISESIPFSTDHARHPKLATMLFLSHTFGAGANAAKIYFTKNPVAINATEWLLFFRYTEKQMKWSLFLKESERHDYVRERINAESEELYLAAKSRFQKLIEGKFLIVGGDSDIVA